MASKWRADDILYFWIPRGSWGVLGPGRKWRRTVLISAQKYERSERTRRDREREILGEMD
jgi:hypothetical protein